MFPVTGCAPCMVNEAEWSLAGPRREMGDGHGVQEQEGVACGSMACFTHAVPDF